MNTPKYEPNSQDQYNFANGLLGNATLPLDPNDKPNTCTTSIRLNKAMFHLDSV